MSIHWSSDDDAFYRANLEAGLEARDRELRELRERIAKLETACQEAMRKADDHRRQRDEARAEQAASLARVRTALEAHEAVQTEDDVVTLIEMTMQRLKAYERAEDDAISAALAAKGSA